LQLLFQKCTNKNFGEPQASGKRNLTIGGSGQQFGSAIPLLLDNPQTCYIQSTTGVGAAIDPNHFADL